MQSDTYENFMNCVFNKFYILEKEVFESKNVYVAAETKIYFTEGSLLIIDYE